MGSSPSPIEALKTYLQVEQFTQNSSRRFRLPKWPENLHVEFPGNPMVRTRYFQCHGGPGSIPLQGIKSQQAMQHDQKKKERKSPHNQMGQEEEKEWKWNGTCTPGRELCRKESSQPWEVPSPVGRWAWTEGVFWSLGGEHSNLDCRRQNKEQHA